MTLTELGKYIEHVASLVEVNEATDDEIAGIATAFVLAQRHYTHKETCGPVVASLAPTGPTIREARAALANAKAALPNCAQTLTVVEAAAILGVSKEKVYALCANGELRSNRVGRRVTIQRSELEKFQKRPATSQVGYRHLT